MYAEAVRLARLAGQQFRFRRLYLFGSVVSAAPLAVWSDIDLAVEGLPPDDLFALIGVLSAEARFPLDVKSLDDIPPAAQQLIRSTGAVLHEAR